MKKSTVISKTLLICAMSAAVTGFAASAQADDEKMAGMEKCWGPFVKAGSNDCKTASNSCAGHSTKDGEGFVTTPKGLCGKLVGGHTS